MGERFKELEYHSHIPFLHLVDLVGHEPDELLLKFNLNTSHFVDLIKAVNNYLLQLFHSVGIKYDVRHFAHVDPKLVAVFLQCINSVGYSHHHDLQIAVSKNIEEIFSQDLLMAAEEQLHLFDVQYAFFNSILLLLQLIDDFKGGQLLLVHGDFQQLFCQNCLHIVFPLQQIGVQGYYFIIFFLKFLQHVVRAHSFASSWGARDHDDLAQLALLVVHQQFYCLLDLGDLFFPEFEFGGEKLPTQHFVGLKHSHFRSLHFDIFLGNRGLLIILGELAVGSSFTSFGWSLAHRCLIAIKSNIIRRCQIHINYYFILNLSVMHNQSIEYLASRIKDLEKQVQLHQERIVHLEAQNEQLMGIVVQASHHSVNKTQQFTAKIEKLVSKKLTAKNDHAKDNSQESHAGSMRIKTEYSTKKKETERGKQNEQANRIRPYEKLSKKQLASELQSVRRIERRLV